MPIEWSPNEICMRSIPFYRLLHDGYLPIWLSTEFNWVYRCHQIPSINVLCVRTLLSLLFRISRRGTRSRIHFLCQLERESKKKKTLSQCESALDEYSQRDIVISMSPSPNSTLQHSKSYQEKTMNTTKIVLSHSQCVQIWFARVCDKCQAPARPTRPTHQPLHVINAVECSRSFIVQNFFHSCREISKLKSIPCRRQRPTVFITVA